MARRVSIIGSFQKYYAEVIKIIRLFRENDLWVLSPKDSRITGKIEDFVIFESDNQQYNPEEIQMITLDRILESEAVYVFNPGGYVGRTTCYEIGFCYSRSMPLYFFSTPNDLPIPINEEQIVTPESFVKLVLQNDFRFNKQPRLCEPATRSFNNIMNISPETKQLTENNVVICGSMHFYNEMLDCQRALKKLGIDSIVPKDENIELADYSEEEFRLFKRKVSNSYLRKIRDRNTVAVLIINTTKNGIPNYIGANTLVELSMAFVWNRKIFLFNDIYEPLADELLAWDSICLHGNLNSITKYLSELQNSIECETLSPVQQFLFEE